MGFYCENKYGGCYEDDRVRRVPPDGDPDSALIYQLRQYAATNRNGKMGQDCVVPKWILDFAADRIETLRNGVTDV